MPEQAVRVSPSLPECTLFPYNVLRWDEVRVWMGTECLRAVQRALLCAERNAAAGSG